MLLLHPPQKLAKPKVSPIEQQEHRYLLYICYLLKKKKVSLQNVSPAFYRRIRLFLFQNPGTSLAQIFMLSVASRYDHQATRTSIRITEGHQTLDTNTTCTTWHTKQTQTEGMCMKQKKKSVQNIYYEIAIQISKKICISPIIIHSYVIYPFESNCCGNHWNQFLSLPPWLSGPRRAFWSQWNQPLRKFAVWKVWTLRMKQLGMNGSFSEY